MTKVQLDLIIEFSLVQHQIKKVFAIANKFIKNTFNTIEGLSIECDRLSSTF